MLCGEFFKKNVNTNQWHIVAKKKIELGSTKSIVSVHRKN